MDKPEYISIEEFKYNLPESRIAKYPLKERDRSRLLVYHKGKISSSLFHYIPANLNPDSHLLFNDSRVIHARLIFYKETGAKIEVFCLEPLDPYDYQINFSSKGKVSWKCLVGNSKKWKNEVLQTSNSNHNLILFAERISNRNGEESIEFRWEPDHLSFSEIIEKFGNTPIPPYLDRDADESDSLRYQTVYSRHEGSVAAPTAGLHFTDNLLKVLRNKGYEMDELTLHVGAGTFTPVKSDNSLDHIMHAERFHVNKNVIENLLKKDRHITPVGTTSCRTLESLYWMGVKIKMGFDVDEFSQLDQFEAYELEDEVSRNESLEQIAKYLKNEKKNKFFGTTGIMISPGYKFRMTDSLITNFHQPGSTLLMLIAALVGDKWREIYNYALDNDFRFLSYGDSSLLFPEFKQSWQEV